MSHDSDIPVAVVSGRVDIDLAISLWISGYTAHQASRVETVLDVTEGGGLVLLDARSTTCDDWIEQLRMQGYGGPVVLLDDRVATCVAVDSVAVRAPWTLDGMKEAFDLAWHMGSSPGADHAAISRDDLFALRAPPASWTAKVAPEGDVPTESEPRPRKLRPLL